jgi:autotransporter translocation and assembly factor TamB
MGRRILAISVAVVVLLVSVALVGLLIFTNTDYGRERVRTFAQSAIQGAARHGVVRLGRVTGNLLEGFTIANVSIKDSAGGPFLVADTVSLNYGLRALLLKRLELSDVRLVRPLVVMDRPPGDSSVWNYKAIFTSDTPSVQRDTTKMHFGDWIVLRDVTMLDGRVVIRSPWKPKETYTGAQRDSAVARAVSGKERVVVQRRDSGYQKVIDFRSINAAIPYLRLKQPDTKVRRLEIEKASVVALPFHPPAAIVNNFVGALEFTSDSIWFKDTHIWMPGSKAAGDGRYNFVNDDFDLVLRGQPISFADVRFIMPQMPARGEGTLDFRLRWRGDTTTYIAQKADIRIDSARAGGDFAISMVGTACGSTTRTSGSRRSTPISSNRSFRGSRFAARNARWRGEARRSTGLMRVDGDVAFDDARYGRSRVVAKGALGTTGHGVRFRDLDVTLDPCRSACSNIRGDATDRRFDPRFGAPQRRDGSPLVVRTDLTHDDGGLRSRISGNATLRLGNQPGWISTLGCFRWRWPKWASSRRPSAPGRSGGTDSREG